VPNLEVIGVSTIAEALAALHIVDLADPVDDVLLHSAAAH
jgi:hypothetical protein